jgi:hypothetical protein
MGTVQTRIYRNDSDTDYVIPGLGEIKAGQRVSFQGEFPPAINLENFPGLVDVIAEEEEDKGRDYNKYPETVDDTEKGDAHNG